jgi:NAD(P)-dependent dehydrogenase (short-subunit alcohol dehydrogenase family)
MELGIRGKKALVTGGGRGLGLAISSCLAREGADVAVVSRTEADVRAFVAAHGSRHIGLAYDLMDEGAPAAMVDELVRQFGYPDILIHNVGGTLGITEPLCGIADWRRVYRFNLEIAIELNLLLVPHLQEQKWGRVVHVSSIAGLENQGTVPYCSIKAALNAYTRSFGRFVASDGVAVSAVLPGAVFTAGGYWDVATRERPAHVAKYLDERMAIRRFGEPDEIGQVVAFLCSEHASFIVGSSILVDGGQGRAFQNEQ